jgi:hypothetical protein
MNFQEAVKILNIEDYAERIWNSNSHGELRHIQTYILLANALKENSTWFRSWFEGVVKIAEETWEKPESIFQHIDKIIIAEVKEIQK